MEQRDTAPSCKSVSSSHRDMYLRDLGLRGFDFAPWLPHLCNGMVTKMLLCGREKFNGLMSARHLSYMYCILGT